MFNNRKIASDLFLYIAYTYGADVPEHMLRDLVTEINNQVLNNYFSETGEWKPEMEKFTHTGWDIVDRVNALNPQAVLDVGCGYNLFKGKIQNLHGIDPYNENADEKIHIGDLNWNENQYDVILCLGSVNFGSEEKIFAELHKLVSILKMGGSMFFRVNPGITHNRQGAQWIDFFEWSEHKAQEFAAKLGCEVVEMAPDAHRLYFRWLKTSRPSVA